MILQFTEKKIDLQVFYTSEIKISLIVLVFFGTNINTDVDAFAKKLITFSTKQLLNKHWPITITASVQRPYNVHSNRVQSL